MNTFAFSLSVVCLGLALVYLGHLLVGIEHMYSLSSGEIVYVTRSSVVNAGLQMMKLIIMIIHIEEFLPANR